MEACAEDRADLLGLIMNRVGHLGDSGDHRHGHLPGPDIQPRARPKVRAHGRRTPLKHGIRRLQINYITILRNLNLTIFQNFEAALIVDIAPSLKLN